MKYGFISIIVAFLFLAACQKDVLVENFNIGQEENFQLGNGYFSNDNNLKLTISEINDSRCPGDMLCIKRNHYLG